MYKIIKLSTKQTMYSKQALNLLCIKFLAPWAKLKQSPYRYKVLWVIFYFVFIIFCNLLDVLPYMYIIVLKAQVDLWSIIYCNMDRNKGMFLYVFCMLTLQLTLEQQSQNSNWSFSHSRRHRTFLLWQSSCTLMQYRHYSFIMRFKWIVSIIHVHYSKAKETIVHIRSFGRL